MGYLEMKFRESDLFDATTCIGVGYEDFLTDLVFTSKDMDYAVECFHEKMHDLLEKMADTKIPLPLAFTVEIDGDMTILGCPYRYTFLVMAKKMFQKAYRDYEIDSEIMAKCLALDTDAVAVYCGMSICG